MTAADRPSVTDNARPERPLRCDGTPHPEGAIPPLSEHDYRFDGDDPYVVCARCGERRDALTGDVLAADRPPITITCARCGRGIQPGGTACCPLPKSGTHRWGATDTTKEN